MNKTMLLLDLFLNYKAKLHRATTVPHNLGADQDAKGLGCKDLTRNGEII
jgi:hypothetical protein